MLFAVPQLLLRNGDHHDKLGGEGEPNQAGTHVEQEAEPEMRDHLLLEAGAIVICAGGGGIPVTANATGGFSGVEAVIDKDLSSALLAQALHADRGEGKSTHSGPLRNI